MPQLESQKEFIIGRCPDDNQKSTVIMHVGTDKAKKSIDYLRTELQAYFKERTKDEQKKLKVVVAKLKSNDNEFDKLKLLDLSEKDLLVFKNILKDESKVVEVQKLRDKIFLYEIMLGNPKVDGDDMFIEDLENLPGPYSDYILSEFHKASMNVNFFDGVEDSKKK